MSVRSLASSLVFVVLLAVSSRLAAQVPLSGNVFDGSGGPLLSGIVYHLSSGTTVPLGQTLTIQPGAVLKFNFGAEMTVAGDLQADASGGAAIVFTEIADDSAGGDTNLNGPSVGSPGQWRGLTITNGASAVLNNAQFRFSGQAGRAALDLDQNSTAGVTTCQFSDYSASGLDLSSAALPMVTGCSFTNGDRPVRNCTVNALPGLSNNVASGNSVNNAVNINNGTVTGNVVVDASSMLGGAHVVANGISIASGNSLTLGPGVILKLSTLGAAVSVGGQLVTNGTAGNEVILTVYEDDDHGGDTNLDGPSNGVPGRWRGVAVNQADPGCALTHTIIRYSGQAGFPGIDVGASELALSHVQSTDHSAPGVDLNSTDRMVTIQDCVFDRTSIPITGCRWFHLESFSGNSAANCTSLAAIRVTFTSILGNLTISRSNLIGDVVVTAGPTGISPLASLTLNDGVIVKEQVLGSNFSIQGGLNCNGTAGSEVVFTVITDDSHGGDTNVDGAASSPAPGTTRGLNFAAGSTGALQSTRVRFSGQAAFPGISSAADISMIDCVVEDCLGDGLDLQNFALGATVVGCAFNNCAIAVDGVRLSGLANFSNNTATGCSVRNCIRAQNETAPASYSLVKSQLINDVVEMNANFVVFMGETVTIGPGITVKSSVFGSQFSVFGSLICQGTPTEPVVFTTLQDDSYAGDTNEDGPSSGAPGTWRGFFFGADSGGSALSNTVIRYAGQAAVPAADIHVANISMTDSMIIDCAAAAVSMAGTGARPTIRGCTFDNNAYSIRGARWESFENVRDNSASGNSVFDSPFIEAGVISFDAQLSARSMIGGCFITSVAPGMVPGVKLDIERGVVVKTIGALQFGDGQGFINLLGTGAEPVVLTTLADDDYAGDTNKDGPSSGSAGSWRGIIWGDVGVPRRNEFAVLRYCGQAALPGIDSGDPLLQLRAIRVEHAAGPGFMLRDLGAPADNLVAFDCGGVGIDLSGVNNDVELRFPTVASCGTGIRVSPTYMGRVDGAISSGNTTNYVGLTATSLFDSNGDAALDGMNGNINVDPLFVDPSLAAGDLNLQIGSPCIDAANFALGMIVAADHRESSRLNDHDLDGTVGCDMGAYEFSNYSMAITGQPILGQTMSFTLTGLPGIGQICAALLDGQVYNMPYGMVLVGTQATALLEDLVYEGYAYPITIPNMPQFLGMEFGIQMGGAALGDTTTGNITNLYRGIVQD